MYSPEQRATDLEVHIAHAAAAHAAAAGRFLLRMVRDHRLRRACLTARLKARD
jgi:hypothetical protein